MFKFVSILILGLFLDSFSMVTPYFENESYHFENDTLLYFFTGHTYDYSRSNRIDYRIEGIDMEKYDRIWIGGDMTPQTGRNFSLILYVDSVFHISRPENHWALGNHDHRDGNFEWFSKVTKRPLYYSYYQDGITTVVMNTNLNPSNCEDLEKQFAMIKNVCDTIEASSHLIFIMHHNIVRGVEGFPQEGFANHTGFNWNTNCDDSDANYMSTIYPMQVEVRNRGVEVLNLIGDSGWGGNKDFMSKDSIWYLSSGLSDTQGLPEDTIDVNKIIVFKHIPSERELSWEFQSLDSLYKVEH